MDTRETAVAPRILVAEDEETEVLLFQLALQSAGLSYPVIVARDGQEAIDYLAGNAPYENRLSHPLPALVMLDLKMPRMTGFDVLSWLGSQPQLQNIPAVVLSSSSYPEDIKKATQLGAREYYIKPHTLVELARLLQSVGQRWLAPGTAAAH
jgi:CheY-like chemotaxis protein